MDLPTLQFNHLNDCRQTTNSYCYMNLLQLHLKNNITQFIISKLFIFKKISDPPVFKQLPTSVEGDDKEKINLACDVDGNPLEIVWVHDPIDRVRNVFFF